MTREEAIAELEHLSELEHQLVLESIALGLPASSRSGCAVRMAIKALKQVETIDSIIDVSNTIIQEDVIKYKMIVDIVKGG